MQDNKKHHKKNLLDTFNEKQSEGNVENTLLKGAVDAVAGSVIGTGVGALSGSKASIVGIGLILAGHYIGDKSGLLRITGASTMAYGIGKANEYKNNPELSSPTKRLSALKDDWLTAFHLKWKKETNQSVEGFTQHKENQSKQKEESQTTSELAPIPENPLADLSVLDEFEKINEAHAASFIEGKEDMNNDYELNGEFDRKEDFEKDDNDEIDDLLNDDIDLSLV